ncbi:HRASLS2 [Branchiostoma lanceolatum]|uniref:HRASLS2 protein n=1 Tax=Branchiostoma lanceolatum TaxID=7740 RepID=A0A8J9YYT0_BRALA|nr:HRASLS2 [Branchiostoma lanceolatum]
MLRSNYPDNRGDEYEYSRVVVVRGVQLKSGDLLEFPRKLGHSHWAVYAGNENVVHRTGSNDGLNLHPASSASVSGVQLDKAKVKEEPLSKVAGASKFYINNYKDKDKKQAVLPGLKIVERARSQLGKSGYNLFFNNCEHFATWCRYGKGTSKQVSDAASFIIIIIIIIVAAFICRRCGPPLLSTHFCPKPAFSLLPK